MPIDESALHVSLERLAKAHTEGVDLMAVLVRLSDACVELFGVTGGGILLADSQNAIRHVTASDESIRALETAETECGDGPLVRAFVTNQPLAVSDITTDLRWPRLARILSREPVRAVVSTPIRLGGVPVGTLATYRSHVHGWDASEVSAIVEYSRVVSEALTAALAARRAQELAGQLQYALDHRVDVERAVGYLMGRDRIDAVAAFNVLRRVTRRSARPIGDVALHLLKTGTFLGSVTADGPSV